MNKKNLVSISGINDLSAQALLINQLIYPPSNKRSAVLCLIKSETERKKLTSSLSYWKNIWPNKLTHSDLSDNLTNLITLKLNHQPYLVCGENIDLETTVPDWTEIEKNKLTTKVGKRLSILELKKTLLENDFEENHTCDQPQNFATRGNIIDLWPKGFPWPLKIEFGNKQIEQIFTFDNQGKKITNLDKFYLPRITNLAADKKLVTWLKNFDLIFLSSADPNFIKTAKANSPTAKLINFTSWSKDSDIDIGLTNIPETMPGDLLNKRLTQAGIERILTTNPQPADLTATKITISPFVYLNNWYSKKLKLALLTSKENKSQTKSTSVQKQKIFLQKIKVGDFLVHQDHGLCRFTGLCNQTIDNISSEYLELQFADNDKLYLPPYQINKVTKYVGEPNPKLNRLSGTSWFNTIKKIKEEAVHLALEIIQIQAGRQLTKVPALVEDPSEKVLANSFSFDLTPDQTKTWSDIKNDLSDEKPMDRLLCGDVAFGKTELALRAAYRALVNNFQVALLAPTTILVQQHYDVFRERLEPLGIKVGLLSRWQETAQQKEIINDLKNNKINLIIGTHRLLSGDVQIPNLKLLIIDEEQKFGVKAKEKLRRQKPNLHTLTMSATPIPRTLNYSLSGIRDISLIQTPPPGRLPVETNILPWDKNSIKQAIENELKRQGQVYYLIRKVREMPSVYEFLTKLFPKKIIKLAHGQLPARELAQTMQKFDQGKIDILLCSTIIENGLDLPNANTLIVDNAAHFGLSQLYQLRGRIGRSNRQGYAYMFFQRQKLTGLAAARLEALRSAYELGSGFEIALKDLEIRGAGNLLGKEQHGQIAAIGLNLYTQLLDESVNNLLTNTPIKPKLDVIVDLPITSTLNDEDVENEINRLSTYQHLAACQSDLELDREVARLFAEHRSTAIINLVNILRLKLACQEVGIFQVEGRILTREPSNTKITLSLVPDHNNKKINQLLEYNNNWLYDGNHLKIKTKEMKTDNWLEELIANIKLLK